MRLRLTLLLLAIIVLSSPAQEDEGRVYFSLNTDRPVRPGEQAIVRVQSQGLRELDFRIYRINDPVQFFRQLEDPHQFGGARRPRVSPAARTPLEKFAAWKRRWRGRLRDLARAQFTAENRHSIRANLQEQPAAKPTPSATGPQFAGVSILNPQQLVRSWKQPIQTRQRWEPANVPITLNEKGLYVVEATDQKKQAYTIISVTDLVLITKGASGRALVRAVDRTSGAGVANCPVQVYDWVRKEEVTRGNTNDGGLLEVKLEHQLDEGILIMARRDADFAVASMHQWALSTDDRRNLTGYVYTDRPVYRPGHKVSFKSILRNLRGSSYEIPSQSSAQVTVDDPQGKSLLKQKMSITSFGTVAGDLDLPADAAIGYYSVNVSLGTEEGEAHAFGGFHVEAYRKPDYEVKVTTEARRALQGGSLKATINARYYYGEPVAGANVTWVVHRYRYWPPWWETEEGFGGDEEEGGYGGEQISENKGQLDANGNLTVTVPTDRAEHDYTYRIEARVADSSNRQISGSSSFLATRASFMAFARPEKWVYAPGDPVRIIVETRDYDSKPVGGIAFRLDVAPSEWRKPAQAPILAREGKTGPEGKGTVEFPAPPSGAYELRLTLANPAGGQITEQSWLWISGAWSGGTAEKRIQIVPDKSSYAPGDTAKVLIITGVPQCDVWVSLEGKMLYWSKFIRVTGGTATVEVPIQSVHAPNVFLDAVFVHDNSLFRSSKSLKVPPVEKQIQVEVQSSRAKYKPGEPATFLIQAKDYKGRPVQGEFSVGIVDEAIYAIKREAQPDILNVFYGRTWNRVATDTSLSYYFYGEAGTRRMQLARIQSSHSRAQLKPDKPTGPKIRKSFPDTAYWIADLRTDALGHAEVQMSFPDSLTTWRTTARGVTRDTMVGGAVQRTIVRKDVILSIAAPRFFTEGDEVTLPVLVRNYTSSEQKARVSLQAQGVQIISGGDREITIPSRGEGRADYRVRITAPGKAILTAKALAAAESDALELTLPIEPYGLKMTSAAQKRLDDSNAGQIFPFTFPSEALPGNRSVTIHLTPSVAGAVFGALDYLITYPYGCTEQTMSSFLPNVIVSQALRDLNLPSNIDPRDLTKKVNAGLERLYGYQHDDGGWGWWHGDDSDPFMTAYVALGLTQASAAGYSVETWRAGRAREWIMARIGATAKIAPDTRAFMLYSIAMSGKVEAAKIEPVWALRNEMTPFGWAVLGLAFQQLKDSRASEIAARLAETNMQDGEQVYWPSNRDPMIDFPADNSFEATAFAVRFLAKAQPDSPLIDRAAQWLVNHRDQGYYWASTKRTAFVIYGLTEVLRRSGELKPSYRARVLVNGREVLAQSFGPDDALKPQPAKVKVPIDSPSAEVRVEKTGGGRLYASTNWEYRSTGETSGDRAQPQLNPVRITRQYFRLNPVKDGDRIVHELEPLAGDAKPGDIIAVRINVQGATNDQYFVVEDPLPSGAEVIPRDDLYALRGRPTWWWPWYQRRELRDSRVTWFPWSIPKQGLDYVYLLRFTNAGSYKVAPARVEPMYTPGQLSWTESHTLEVKP